MSPTASPAARNEVSADYLRNLITERYPDTFMAYADLFAIGCLIHLQGQHKAGRKLIDQVRRALPPLGNKTYMADLLQALPGNELRFAREIHAHLEVNELLEMEERRLSSPEYAEASEPLSLATVTEVRAHSPKVTCPHCRTTVDDWQRDPRGQRATCGRCRLAFSVAPNATVMFD